MGNHSFKLKAAGQGGSILPTVKAPEEMREIVCRNSNSCVGDMDQHPSSSDWREGLIASPPSVNLSAFSDSSPEPDNSPIVYTLTK